MKGTRHPRDEPQYSVNADAAFPLSIAAVLAVFAAAFLVCAGCQIPAKLVLVSYENHAALMTADSPWNVASSETDFWYTGPS